MLSFERIHTSVIVMHKKIITQNKVYSDVGKIKEYNVSNLRTFTFFIQISSLFSEKKNVSRNEKSKMKKAY